jgi:RND family efflux transporter MFP subunit
LVFAGFLGAAACGAAWFGPGLLGAATSSATRDFDSAITRRTKVAVTVATRGDIESAKNLDVVSQVEGQATIIFIKAEGSPVKKGELVCELDSAALRDALTNQTISTRKSESDYQGSVKTREVAQFSVREYLEGTYPQSEESMLDTIQIAKIDLERVQRQLEWSDRMMKQGYVTPSQNQGDRLTVAKAEISLREAQTRLLVLRDFSKQKQLTQLQSAVDQALADEGAKKMAYDLEQSKENKLRKQVEYCKMYAPGDGMIVYANDGNPMMGMTGPKIEEGASVRERQRILSLPDITRMRVNAKLDEALIGLVELGQQARIKIDALTSEPLEGKIYSIGPIAVRNQFSISDTRTHTTLIAVDRPPIWMRPGMTAQVEILVNHVENALAIPITSVLQFRGKNHVYVATAEGPRLREVQIGMHNDKLIEIKSGLRDGESVALEPITLMTPDEKRDAFALETHVETDQPWDSAIAGSTSPGRKANLESGAGG